MDAVLVGGQMPPEPKTETSVTHLDMKDQWDPVKLQKGLETKIIQTPTYKGPDRRKKQREILDLI